MPKKILIMDDSATARALFKAHLMTYSEFEVVETNKADEALELAKQHKPVLIVLDYNMPDMSGTEVAKLLQQQGIMAMYVLLTGNTQDHIVKEAHSLGFFDIIEKPVSQESIGLLVRKLQNAID